MARWRKYAHGKVCRVIFGFVWTVDLNELIATAQSIGVWGFGFAWIGNALHGSSEPGFLYMSVVTATPTARRVAFDADWPSQSLRHNASLHGSYNASTGLPFYGDDVFEPTIWDTDDAPVGDGKPDDWGSLVYDTVWLYAEAVSRMVARGDSPFDGVGLRAELLASNVSGVTGHLMLDQQSQDRVQAYELFNVQTVGDGSTVDAVLIQAANYSSVQWMGGMVEVTHTHMHVCPPYQHHIIEPPNPPYV